MGTSPRGVVTGRLTAALAAVTLLVLAMTAGCPPKTNDRSIRWVTPDEAQRLMVDRTGPLGLGGVPNGVYLDPRTTAKFEAGHIPGAVNIPFPDLDRMFPTLRDRTLIVVYGTDFADDQFIGGVSKRLIELGHSNVRTIRGGLRAWEQAGGEIVK